MADEPESLVLRYLRRMDDRMTRMGSRLEELASEMRGMRTHMAGFMQDQVSRDIAMGDLRQRLDCIERRLDIQEDAS